MVPSNTYNSVMAKLGEGFFCCQEFPFDPAEMDDFFSVMYGHHVVAVMFALMYSPYIGQILASFGYTLLAVVLLMLQHFGHSKWVKAAWGVMCLLNIILMQSGLVGLGLSNYDLTSDQCYYIAFK
jgi:hypothetical protein